MRFIKIFLSLITAFGLELILGRWLAFGQIQIPLTAGVLFFWFWRMRLGERFGWGIATGTFMDSLYPEPFGAHLFVFFLLAFFTEFLQFVFSNIELPLTRLIAIAVSVFLFLNLLPFVSSIFYSIYGVRIWTSPAFLKLLPVSLIWSLLLPPAILGAVNLMDHFLFDGTQVFKK